MEPLPVEFTQVYFRAAPPAGGWPRRFAIVTAHNPNGRITDPAANLVADEALRGALERQGLDHFRVTGGSRDGRHQEPGWGIVLTTPSIAQDLSVRFRQLAFFWIEKGRLALVDARTGDKTDQVAWAERWLGAHDGTEPA